MPKESTGGPNEPEVTMTTVDLAAFALKPTRRLTAKAKKVFLRVLGEYAGRANMKDAEALTQYAEASESFETNAKTCKRNPVIAGYRGATKRNPACIERDRAQAAMRRLESSLLLGVKYAAKLMALETKNAKQKEAQVASDDNERRFERAQAATGISRVAWDIYRMELIAEDQFGHQEQCWEEDRDTYPEGSPCRELLKLSPEERAAKWSHLL